MKPTAEQLTALDLFRTGESMVIEAGAGTGKTSTLRLLAYSTPRRGRYLAFNKSIVQEVGGKLPDRCDASTAHSLAFRAVGRRYSHRLNGPRIASRAIAEALGIRPYVVRLTGGPKVLQEGFLAGHVMRALTRFCQSADDSPLPRHFQYVEGIDMPDSAGHRTFENNQALSSYLEGALAKAWTATANVDGGLPFRHDHYLKLWALERPVIFTDYLLLDEAQDTDPVLAGVVAAQRCQVVAVGDSAQAIYEWRGAINAMAGFDSEHRRVLSQSFRFGPAIAEKANEVLEELGGPLRLTGLESIPSTVGPLEDRAADAILCRTNARALESVLEARKLGTVAYLVGEGRELLAFANAVQDLKDEGFTSYPDLACFTSWGAVQDYVRQDPQGDELRLLVDLVDEYGVPTIRETCAGFPREADAELVVSTAHKAKGREWPVVRLATDFATSQSIGDRFDPLLDKSDPSTAELRLRYVAITRARMHLDASVLDQPWDDEETDTEQETPAA